MLDFGKHKVADVEISAVDYDAASARILDAAKAQMQHLQDHRRQVGTQNLRVGKGRTADKILFAVQADADARLGTTTSPRALICTGLRNSLYG